MTLHIGTSYVEHHFDKYSDEFIEELFAKCPDADRVLDGVISVDPFTSSPLVDSDGNTWLVFTVDDNSIRQSKYDTREYKNNYRIVLEGVDDCLWERYVDTKEDVYAFLEQYQFVDLSNDELRKQFMWAN